MCVLEELPPAPFLPRSELRVVLGDGADGCEPAAESAQRHALPHGARTDRLAVRGRLQSSVPSLFSPITLRLSECICHRFILSLSSNESSVAPLLLFCSVLFPCDNIIGKPIVSSQRLLCSHPVQLGVPAGGLAERGQGFRRLRDRLQGGLGAGPLQPLRLPPGKPKLRIS